MVTDTFFDLQRFADDTLVGSTVDGGTFKWQNGSTFVNDGTEEAPVYHLDTTGGVSAVAGSTQIALHGTKAGYSFAVNEEKNNWEFALKGTANTVSGDFSQGTGSYGLNGNVDVTVFAKKTFDETVNGSAAYVKAKNADVTFNAAATGTALTYTFDSGVSNVAVGVDSNDTAVFKGAATNVSLGAAASESAIGSGLNFANGVIVNGENGVVNIVSTTDNTISNPANNESFEFAASTRNPVTISGNEISGAKKGVDLKTTDGFDEAITVNGVKWDAITGDVDEIRFDAKGNAHVSNVDNATGAIIGDGAATVKASADANVGFDALTTTGVVANDVTIQAVTGSISTVAIDLDAAGGIEGIAVDEDDAAIKVAGDSAFDVKVGAKQVYNVSLTADDITFDAGENVFLADVASGKEYSVTGGNAVYYTDAVVKNSKSSYGINGATVAITNNANFNGTYIVTSDKRKEGVDVIGYPYGYLKPNDAVSVTGDSDGYTAIYSPATTARGYAASDVVTFEVNGAKISVQAAFVNDSPVTIMADSTGTNVTVQGIEGNESINGELRNAVVSVASGATYHFKNNLSKNEVTVGGSQYTEVTLNAGGDVAVYGTVKDVINDDAIPRKDADDKKWTERATVGGAGDTVPSNHASVYSDFYNLANSAISSNTLAGYTNQNDTAPSAASSAINITGESPLGTPAALGEAAHVTLTGDSNIGQVPINIQSNENPNVTDVTINLANSNVPSSIVVGTTGGVSAAHNIILSNAGTQATPSYGYIGSNATGENRLSVTSGTALLRHDGSSRATVTGGSGNDTIRADVNDIVSGGTGGDYFYDYSGYALDYKVEEGDVIIASRLSDLGEVTAANIRGVGNQVGFGNGEYLLTLGNIDPNAAVHVKVGVMDNDANLLKGTRDVILANGNGAVEASVAGDNGALVIADASRGAGVHAVFGSEGNDTIHVGNYDAVNALAGNDLINIDQGAAGVIVGMSDGNDSVSGWNYGFDRAAGATQLNAGGANVTGRVFEDRLFVSLDGGASMSFLDTANLGNSDSATMHGQYNILVDDKKLIGIRNGDAGAGYAEITNNDEIADAYFAEREGDLRFTAGVTEDLGVIDLESPNYQDIRKLTLNNNSKAIVMGSADRESVALGGLAVVGANKVVSLAGGNDFISSTGDDITSAGHAFYFGAGDGRDTITNFNHYRGVNIEPDKGASDVILFESLAGVKVEVYDQASARVEFAVTDSDYAVVYEDVNTYDYNRDMYHVLIGNTASDGIAKIGYSTIANAFTYDEEVSYYVGSSGEARDTLFITNTNANVEVRMDGQKQDGKFYRGIGVIDATAASYTNTTLAGSAANNKIIAGGEGTNNFLWGGAGSNTLVGGAGKDFFLYTKNANAYVAGADHSDTSGTNDIITGYDCNNDVIVLSDVTLADINYAGMLQAGGTNGTNCGITENAVTVALNNGGSVTVDPTGQSKVTFYINDGAGQLTAFSADRETGTWQRG